MKKWLISFVAVAVLSACSGSNVSRQLANDSYAKNAKTPSFPTLNTAGLTIIGQDNNYRLPTTNVSKVADVDIRPPSMPLSIINNSVAQFDGERSLIVYSVEQAAVYNLSQIERLLREENISYENKESYLETNWASSTRLDEAGNVQLRYRIDQLTQQNVSALAVSLIEAKRDNVIFTPSTTDKQRYSADLLNRFVSKLNSAYLSQQQALSSNLSVGALQTALVTDANGHLAVAMGGNFAQAWQKLGEVLPQLGFDIKEEIPGRGYRDLKYKSPEEAQWLRLGITDPKLEKGDYSMQINAQGRQSTVVIFDEKKNALSGEQAQAIYSALQVLLGK